MPKIYLRWEKVGNSLSARWTRNNPQELAMKKSAGLWRAAFDKQDNISYKNAVVGNR